MKNKNFITHCSVCGEKLETKKVFPFRDLLGSGQEIYEIHVGLCNNCGFILNQNPFTPEQMENRYKYHSVYEYSSENFLGVGADNYPKRCARQKHFIEEQLSKNFGGGGIFKRFGNRSGVGV